ncbi:MAG TPA: hypothetical protein VEC19_09895 [Usitatibacter sp.]|nr:hypothetical protein [Usitatibacter sp.]
MTADDAPMNFSVRSRGYRSHETRALIGGASAGIGVKFQRRDSSP